MWVLFLSSLSGDKNYSLVFQINTNVFWVVSMSEVPVCTILHGYSAKCGQVPISGWPSVRPLGYLITYLPFKKPQYGRNHLSRLLNFAAKVSKISILIWIHLFGSHFLWSLLSFKCWYRNQTSASDFFLTRSGINDSDYKYLQNSKLWNWKS